MIFANFHFPEASANVLTHAALDPVAKIPEYKVTAVKVEKVLQKKEKTRKNLHKEREAP
jgi:predicted molibdopterin-dependent oxidoreductase YjgC